MRRRAREFALQMLYQLDVSRGLSEGAIEGVALDTALGSYWQSFQAASDEERTYAERIVRGVVQELGVLDAAISAVSHHWRLTRMEAVDRNLLRLAAYEILRCPDIPRNVSINEAIEISKRFGAPESAAFINGILDRLRESVEGASEEDVGAKSR
ncbi:MAG: transcription antitermination factor NusB [Myxococcota bacterium]